MTDHNIARTTFETKDSGERQAFASGMVRDTTVGKTLWHLVASGPMLRRWAELLTRGAEKYDADNWLKADGQEELDRFRQSAFRHFMQWYNGDQDEDHAAAVVFNINGAEYVRDKLGSENVPVEMDDLARTTFSRFANMVLSQTESEDWLTRFYMGSRG